MCRPIKCSFQLIWFVLPKSHKVPLQIAKIYQKLANTYVCICMCICILRLPPRCVQPSCTRKYQKSPSWVATWQLLGLLPLQWSAAENSSSSSHVVGLMEESHNCWLWNEGSPPSAKILIKRLEVERLRKKRKLYLEISQLSLNYIWNRGGEYIL